jgi:hypothetical protein
MTREETITMLANMRDGLHETGKDFPYRDKCIPYMKEACDMAIEALKQEPREDEVILTKKEYGELVSSEFDNGYAKGYREALEQKDSILDKIKAEIEALPKTYPFVNHIDMYVKVSDVTKIIDKYKAESEE